jgi:hypothetical protein
MNRCFLNIIFVLLSCSLSACSIRSMVVDEVAQTAEHGISAFEQDDDMVLMEKAFPANIKLMEMFLESRPQNYRMLTLLSQLYGSYGFCFFETRREASQLGITVLKDAAASCDLTEMDAAAPALDRYFLKGAAYALRALAVHHEKGEEKMKNVNTIDVFFASLTQKDVAALFWYGFNLAEYINLHRDSVTALSQAFLVQKAMLRVIELDPGYFHGISHLVLLAYYGSRPEMAGGDPEAAQQHYQKLKETAGNDFLLADLYYARHLLVQKQEREKFTAVLNDIISREPSTKRYALFNQVAVCRARVYLEAADYFFIADDNGVK